MERPLKLLRLPEVIDRTGRSRSGLYRDLSEGKFPAPVKIGERSVAWREADVLAWQESRPLASFTRPPKAA